MLQKLSPSPAERLRDRFRDHPLLLTCQQAFHHYMASMEQFDFTAEELFVEVADVLDGIFEEPTNARTYLAGLWDSLKIKLKQQFSPTPPQADLDTVCGVLHYVVAATLSLHWRSFYNTELVGVLRDIAERKGMFANAEEKKEIIMNLCRCAEGLNEWINEYEDSGEWLSEEIGSFLAQPQTEEGHEQNEQGGQGTQPDGDMIKAEKVIRGLFPSDVEGKQYERFMREAQGKERLALAKTLRGVIGYSRGNATKKDIHWALGRLGFVVGSYSNFKL